MEIDFNNKRLGFFIKYPCLTLILIYNIVTLLLLGAFYFIIPIVMGYAPGFIRATQHLGASYNLQFVFVAVFCTIVGTTLLYIATRGMGQWWKLNAEKQQDAFRLAVIRNKSINLPYIIFIVQLCIINIPLLLTAVIVKSITDFPLIILIKLFTIAFSIFSLAAVISHLIATRVFKLILIHTYSGDYTEGMRIGLRKKIFLQIVPMLIVAMLMTSTLGYARLIDEKGNLVYYICKSTLLQKTEHLRDIYDEQVILEELSGIQLDGVKVMPFIQYPDEKIVIAEGYQPSAHIKYYLEHPVNGDRVYGDSKETQGVLVKVQAAEGQYKLGYLFQLGSEKTVSYMIASFLILLSLNMMVLYLLSRNLSKDISNVAESLIEIAEGERMDLERKIPITSKDEIGDLAVAFNKILDLEKVHLMEMQDNHEIMMEQERLASLGQLIGGIAHNMRTPIMSLAGAIEGLNNLIEEYSTSIDDPEVTREDHHEIAGEMLVWTNKMKPYCGYMSEIITTMREQILHNALNHETHFTLDELAKRIDLLMCLEISKNNCQLVTEYHVPMDILMKGQISILIQILNNLIQNAIEAYEGSGGKIELKVLQSGDSIIFIIKDYGKGIPKSMNSAIFKQMITTKGKSGTGLGLFMSYANLKAGFGGRMWFESELGKGTEFFVSIQREC